MCPSKIVVCQPSTEQKTKKILFSGDWEDERVNVTGCSGGEQGGVAGAEFSADVTFSQWFCSLINACSSLRSLLCLLERNTALQGKMQGNLGDLDAQNDVSVRKLQFCFKRYILRIPSVFCYRGNFLPAYPLNHFAYPWGYAYPSLGTDDVEQLIDKDIYPDLFPGQKRASRW